MESLTFINGRMAPGRTYIKGFIMASTTIAKSLCGEIAYILLVDMVFGDIMVYL